MLNTKLLMTASALIMGTAGILLSFLPQESAELLGWPSSVPVVYQLLGALYFGFAMVNWTAKGSILGGIYGRSVTIGNFVHFMVAALALTKIVFSDGAPASIITLATVYVVLAVLFGYVFFTHPTKKTQSVD